jgi:hypothetical protein
LWLHLINSASYDQCLYKTNIGSHMLPFSWPHDLWPWIILKGQIKVIEFQMRCIS